MAIYVSFLPAYDDLWRIISLAAALFAFPLIAYHLLKPHFFSSSKPVPPGKLGLPLLGENIAFFASFNKPLGVYEFLIPRYKKYGSTFKTNVLGDTFVFVSGKGTGKFIFGNEDKLFNLAVGKSMEDVIGHNSLFQARGELHKKMRRIIGDPLSMDSLKKHLNGIEDVALQVLNRWKDSKKVCVLDETIDYAFQIISYILFSSKPGLEQDLMKEYFNKVTHALVVLPVNVPGFSYYEGIKAREKMYALLDKVIEKRMKGEEYYDDFVQSILDKNKQNDSTLSNIELKDNLMAILFAGHETSATSLMWAIKFIEENPSVKKNLIVEHLSILSKRGSNSYLTWEEVNNMPYTNKFINETLRTSNIARLLPRIVLQDIELNGYLVKKGWKVIIDTQAPHFDETNFVEPHEFDPSRFDEAPRPYTFMPFGGGARMCIGMNLAKVEMLIFLHHLITKYRWTSLSEDCKLAPTLLPKLKSGYPIEVHPFSN